MLIGDWLKQRRKQLDQTQRELAEQVGCSTVLIRKIEAGERRPSQQIARRLAQALLVPPEQQEQFVALLRQSVFLAAEELADDPHMPPLPGAAAGQEHGAGAVRPQIHGLPVYATPFVGRQAELEHILGLLCSPARLLTLVGAGGMGKTRLAVEAVQRLAVETQADCLPGKPQQIYYLPLAGVAEARRLPVALAAGLGLAPTDGRAAVVQLASRLGDTPSLLVLDNFEHLLPQGLELLEELQAVAPETRLLVTSRSRLGLAGEWVFEIAGLAYPAAEQAGPDWQSYSAMQLFVHNARRTGVDLAPGALDTAAIARICELVDGLPLGIELAAAWMRLLPASEIAAEIQHNLDFLTSRQADRPERHHSLRAVFTYSWELLGPGERQALAALAVLAGRFDREAAEAVAEAGLPVLAGLLDTSLLARAGERQYEIHPLLRQFALEKLAESGAAASARDRHLSYFRQQAAALQQAYQQGQVEAWRSGLERGMDDFEAALQHALDSSQAEAGLLLAGDLWRYWTTCGALRAGAEWLRRLLADEQDLPAALLARAWYCLAALEHHQGEYERAQGHLQTSLAYARSGQDPETLAAVTNELGLLALDHDQPAEAEARFRESLAAMQAREDRAGEALLIYNLGRALYAGGQRAQAEELWQRSLELAQQIGDVRVQVYSQYMLGVQALEDGELALARERLALSLIHSERLGDRVMRTWSLERMAMLELRGGNPPQAVRRYAQSTALREQYQLALPPVHQAEYRQFEQALRQALPAEEYERHWQAGCQAAREELAGPGQPGPRGLEGLEE